MSVLKLLWSFNAGGRVVKIASAPNGNFIFVGFHGGAAFLGSVGNLLRRLPMQGTVRAGVVLSGGSALVASKIAGDAVIIGVDRGGASVEEPWRLDNEIDIWGLDVTRDERHVVLSGAPKGLWLLDRSSRRVQWGALKENHFWHVAVSADGQRIVAASRNDFLVLLDGDGREIWRQQATKDFIGVAMLDDTSVIVAGDRTGMIRCLEGDGTVRWTYYSECRIPHGMAISPCGDYIAVATESEALSPTDGEGSVLLFDCRGQVLGAHPVRGNARDVAFAGSARFLAVGTECGEVLWLENTLAYAIVSHGPFAGAGARSLVQPADRGSAS